MKRRVSLARTVRAGVVVLMFVLSLVSAVSASAGTLDSKWPSGGYVGDVVRGGVWSRTALASNLWIYAPYGMNANFPWYCDVVDVSANTTTWWAGTAPEWNSTWYINHWFRPINSSIINAPYESFSAWYWNGTFVSRVCGNQTTWFSNPACPTISGYVFNDLNGNGTRDAGEPGRAGISVKLLKDGAHVRTAVSDANGYYAFAIDAAGGLVPGSYAAAYLAGESGWVTTRDNVGVWVAEGPGSAGRNFANTNLGRRQVIPPVTTIVADPASPTGANGWYNTPLSVGFSANQPGTTWSALDAGSFSLSASATVSMPEGIHDVRYYSVNGFGDVESTRLATYRVDTGRPANPAVVLSAPASSPTNSADLTAVWSGATDAVSGVQGISYSFSQEALGQPDDVIDAVGVSGVLSSGPLAEGTWYFHVRTQDVAGNWSSTDTYGPFVLDRTAPVTTLTVSPGAPDGTNGWYVSLPVITLAASEPSTVFSACAPDELALYSGPFTLYDGVNDVRYRSVDAAGNQEPTQTCTVKVDTGAPTRVQADWVVSAMDAARISWTSSTDAASGVGRYEVRDAATGALLAQAGGDATSTVLAGLDPSTTYRVVVVPFDVAGNEGAPSDVVEFLLHWTTPTGTESRWFPSGDDVGCTLDSSVTVSFDHISSEGTVTTTPVDRDSAPGAGMFRLVRGPYWNVSTSASFDGWAYVTFAYDPDQLHGLEKNLKLFHWKDNGWHDVTWSIDYVNHTITGRTESFSPFAIVEPLAAVTSVADSAGSDRYTTAALTARRAFDPAGNGSWPGVKHVIIASGDDAASADPLAAAGLCSAYDAPLLLVKPGSVSAQVMQVLAEIAHNNGGALEVHVVGGVRTVTTSCLQSIKAAIPGARIERVLAGGGRYDLAAAIAHRMVTVRGAGPGTVLVANGSDSTKFFDALALSTISAAKGYPILLVSADGVPAQTAEAIRSLCPTQVIVGGGPRTVSDMTLASLNATRWAGGDRYSTATTIAQNAIARGWLSDDDVSIAAKMPDALTGGSAAGKLGGVLLLTDSTHLPWPTGDWLVSPSRTVLHWSVIGGPASVDPSVRTDLERLLAR